MAYAPTVVDLTGLPPPNLVEVISFDRIVAAMVEDFKERWEAARADNPDLPEYDVEMLSYDPAKILLEVGAGREMLLRARVNDAGRATLLPFASGADLDHIAAAYGVERLVVTAATATSPAVMESDARLKRRVQLAPEAFATTGSRGAYIFHALTIDPTVWDAWAWSPRPGRVEVVLAGYAGAKVSDDVVARLVDLFQREDKVPLTDSVAVVRAEVVRYSVAGVLTIPRGPDPLAIKAAAEAAIRAYALSRYRIRQTVFGSGVVAAGRVSGVEDLLLDQPGNVTCSERQIPWLETLSLKSQVLS